MTEFPPYLPLQYALADPYERERLNPDLIGVSSGLSVQSLRWGYVHGAFPMGLGDHAEAPWGWWSPDPRGVLWAKDLRIRRSLRQSAKKLRLTCNQAFVEVLDACADPGRQGRWITAHYRQLYERLHGHGHAHSVEVWDETRLVGGLVCVSIGWVVTGETMFHHHRDASKIALWGLCSLMTAQDAPMPALIDVQWATDHLCSLGAVEMPREDYRAELERRRQVPGGWQWPDGRDITRLIWDDGLPVAR